MHEHRPWNIWESEWFVGSFDLQTTRNISIMCRSFDLKMTLEPELPVGWFDLWTTLESEFAVGSIDLRTTLGINNLMPDLSSPRMRLDGNEIDFRAAHAPGRKRDWLPGRACAWTETRLTSGTVASLGYVIRNKWQNNVRLNNNLSPQLSEILPSVYFATDGLLCLTPVQSFIKTPDTSEL